VSSKMFKDEPLITVICAHCEERFDETEVEETDIHEDELGRDVVSFKCPNCGKETESFRFG